jgi:cysteine desulfurase
MGILFHCDAAQAIGKIAIDVKELDIDFLSVSGHKFYAPKGIGALWVKSGLGNFLEPIMFGGFSEKGLRPGTKPVPLIAALGHASLLAKQRIDEESS